MGVGAFVIGLSQISSFFSSDTDECKHGENTCHQICQNTIGSFSCSCYDGFNFNDTTHVCVKGIYRVQRDLFHELNAGLLTIKNIQIN